MESPASSPPTCCLCGDRPVYRDRAKDQLLCARHLGDSIRQRAEPIVASGIQAGDRVGIALSGGKDSTVLLHLLHDLLGSREDVELIALTVDEGIQGYRECSLSTARDHTRRLNIAHRVISFTDLAGTTLDTLVQGREARSCSLCGILRRRALLQLARQNGVTVIATGHCLNDEAQTVLMNTLRGDLPRLLRSPQRDPRFIPRLKPLSRVSEKEITVYAMATGLYTDLPECPYAHHALRSEVRSMLDRFEQEKPGTMERIVSFPGQIASRGVLLREPPPVPCDRCGEPSVNGRCRACHLLDTLLDPGR